MTKQSIENLELGLLINLREAKRLKERNKELSQILSANKKIPMIDRINRSITSANKVKHRLGVVLSKSSTKKILKNNPKAKLKQIPDIPKINVNNIKEVEYKKLPTFVINILKKEFISNEVKKSELKEIRIKTDKKLQVLLSKKKELTFEIPKLVLGKTKPKKVKPNTKKTVSV